MNAAERTAPLEETTPLEEATPRDATDEGTAEREAVTESHVGQISAPSETTERERIQHQLQQLKQRESELRRELAIAEHPELADAIRQIEGRAYGVGRVEAKMAEGLSKSELRKKDTLEKKLLSAMEKRAELDQQIAAFETELAPLGEARTLAFQTERGEALLRLASLLDEHAAAIASAALDLDALIPSLPTWREEIATLRG
jgi:uncharacterized protein YdcH (DUF465 family)